eukprot:CAMPEP_0185607084 /NCGR_PEP_ID=MMETSP0436-20130131/5266_1 /TAXON_ID=626734 ORGANISM="Favella taraikaensis, Strain Fe Narragansett Bay" /NCGR_SAMPLE_ID=MMETSP0436 /ASSEMBLY_ACC=CAM_ASM_000390 /LENGTH=36 /DNA_ID= /DNA_START= /DNA_END= /DNA_ORIENTATION=
MTSSWLQVTLYLPSLILRTNSYMLKQWKGVSPTSNS